ncbi:MAG: prephenate/arogenate dehydrogenase family protein [Pseudomonadota bacterium]
MSDIKTGTLFFERVAFVGIGLIGSSLARAMKQKGLAGSIVISTRRQETLDRARALGLGDDYSLDGQAMVRDADLVVLCVPLGAYEAVARAIAPALKKGAIVTDVGSTKVAVMRQVEPHLPEGVHFVPGHPVAGTEHSGPDAGFASLFENRWCVLTPATDCDPAAVEKIASLWRSCGSTVEIMTPDHHDTVLAMTSHLPHLIAYTIVDTATTLESDVQAEVIKFSAGGFRDFTRIAGSDPVMWRDIFLHNKDSVLEMLQRFSEDLSALQRAIRRGEGEALEEVFRRTREVRMGVLEAHQAGSFDPQEPDDPGKLMPSGSDS